LAQTDRNRRDTVKKRLLEFADEEAQPATLLKSKDITVKDGLERRFRSQSSRTLGNAYSE